MSIGYFVAGVFLTFCEYALIPILYALFRKKEITIGKYWVSCFLYNLIILAFDSIAGTIGYGELIIRIRPYLLYSGIAVWIGGAILKSRSVVIADSSKAQESADVVVEKPTTENYKYICNNCGKLSTGWYQTCPSCGAVGKMEKASPAQIQAVESSRTKQEKQTAPSTALSMREITPIERPNLVPSVSRKEEKSRNEKTSSQKAICHNCGAVIPKEAKFCVNCGRAVVSVPVVKYCRFCGSKLTEGSMYCHNCGKGVRLNNGVPQTREVAAKGEKAFQNQEQQNDDDYNMPSYSTDSVLYKENKDYINSLISEGRLSMKIALYVASDIVLIESGIKDIDLDHDLEVVLRELILEYGVFGAVARYSFVLGLFDQQGALSQEEVAEHKNRVLSLVRQELEQSKENKP